MTLAGWMRLGIVMAGLFVMGRVFHLYAKKQLTVDIAMAWEAVGVGMALVGLVPAFSRWCGLLSAGTAAALFLCGAVVLWAGLRCSVLLSVLQMKTQALAVEVSLLKEEAQRRSEAAEHCRKPEPQKTTGEGVSMGCGR